MKKLLLVLGSYLLLLFAACEPEKPAPVDTPADTDRVAYVLNEGSWGGNNAEISLLNITKKTVDPEWFSRVNGRGLGDVAQDLVRYGSRLYCTVWNSNTLEVIDAATGKSVKQISFGNRGPRYIVCHDGKVYVSCYDRSVVRIDTVGLEIEATCPLSGMQPEQMCLCGENLVVCSSWEYDTDGTTYLYDNKVSVVSLATFAEIDVIPVGLNPTRIQGIDSTRCVVGCAGNYGVEEASAKVLDIATRQCTPLAQAATAMDFHQGVLYHYTTTYDDQWNPMALFFRTDMTTLGTTPILTAVSMPYAYGINYDPATGNLFICNSPYTSTGDIFCYSPDGTLLWQAETGFYCKKVVL